MISLFHADLFIEKNVGTPEQRENLKDFLISISQDDKVKNDPFSNEGCFRFNFNVLNNSLSLIVRGSINQLVHLKSPLPRSPYLKYSFIIY